MDIIADINSRFMKGIMNPNTTDRSRIIALTNLIKGKALEMSEISKGKKKHRNEIRTLLQEYVSLIEDAPEDFLFKTASRGWEDDEDWNEREDLSSSSKGLCMDHVQNEGRGWFSPRRCRMFIQETFGIKYSKDTIWPNELCVRVASKGSIKLYLDENYAQNREESMSSLKHDIHAALCEMLQESSMRREANLRKETLRISKGMFTKWCLSYHKKKKMIDKINRDNLAVALSRTQQFILVLSLEQHVKNWHHMVQISKPMGLRFSIAIHRVSDKQWKCESLRSWRRNTRHDKLTLSAVEPRHIP